MELEDKKTVDVIIPVYNGRKYIKNALSSVLSQTHKPDKIIVVNDGSTDDTLEIIRNFSETSPIEIYILDQRNQGLSAARNNGIKISTADFLSFLDHDDIWSPDKLEKQIRVFTESKVKNLGLVYTDYFDIDKEGRVLHVFKKIQIEKSNRGENLISKNLDKNIIIGSGSGVLVKRKCFEAAGLFDEKLKAFEDWDMWLRIILKFGIDYCEDKLVGIRRHEENMQKHPKKMNPSQVLFYKKWLAIALFNKPTVIPKWFYRIVKSRLNIKSPLKPMPTVSTIIPVYNAEKYINETLKSLLSQTYPIKEIIIVDDGSTDGTREMIREYIQKHEIGNIILLKNKYEKGIAGSLNTGIEISTGEYIARADGDDLYKPKRIEKQIKYLEKNKMIDIVGSSFSVFGDNVNTRTIYRPRFSVLSAFFMVGDMSLCHPSVIFRRSVLKTIKEYPQFPTEDFAFFSRAIKKHRALSLLEPLIYYRRHQKSYSFNNDFLKESRKEIFLGNYRYYTGSDDIESTYSNFIINRDLPIKDITLVTKIASKILAKIKTDYNIKSSDIDFVCSSVFVYYFIAACAIKSTVKRLFY